MARHKLTDTRARTAGPGWHGDGDGLWLRVQATGSRSWVFVTIRHGHRRELGLGAYGGGARQVSLAAARVKAEEVRAILGRGGDPFREMAERRARVKARTFGECADELIESKAPSFRNARHLAQWRTTLATYAAPLRRLPVAEVATDDVVRVLRPLWSAKAVTAGRLRGRIEAVLDYAKALGLREGSNPALWKGHLDHILGAPSKLQKAHHAAMPYADVPGFVERLRAADGVSARALELTILTAARSGEVLGAQWSEVDPGTALWTVPAARMKSGLEHVVPLSPRALEILREAQQRRLSDFVFPGQAPRRPLSNQSLALAMRRHGAGDFTVHGFRSSFRDWAGDRTAFARDVAEAALAHRVGDVVERAYRRGSAIEKRRKLMGAWALYLDAAPAGGEVVGIGTIQAV